MAELALKAMDDMKALPKPHACDTPDTGLPGDEWTCPECGRLWWADEVESEGGLFIEWRPVHRMAAGDDNG